MDKYTNTQHRPHLSFLFNFSTKAALQHGHRTVALTQGQKTTMQAAAASSECLSCVPCEDTLAGTRKKGLLNGMQRTVGIYAEPRDELSDSAHQSAQGCPVQKETQNASPSSLIQSTAEVVNSKGKSLGLERAQGDKWRAESYLRKWWKRNMEEHVSMSWARTGYITRKV